jgi:hypothetical protein
MQPLYDRAGMADHSQEMGIQSARVGFGAAHTCMHAPPPRSGLPIQFGYSSIVLLLDCHSDKNPVVVALLRFAQRAAALQGQLVAQQHPAHSYSLSYSISCLLAAMASASATSLHLHGAPPSLSAHRKHAAAPRVLLGGASGPIDLMARPHEAHGLLGLHAAMRMGTPSARGAIRAASNAGWGGFRSTPSRSPEPSRRTPEPEGNERQAGQRGPREDVGSALSGLKTQFRGSSRQRDESRPSSSRAPASRPPPSSSRERPPSPSEQPEGPPMSGKHEFFVTCHPGLEQASGDKEREI